MGTRGETLYYLFHKSRATPVSPGLLTQSWPLIGQCCSVPSSDWWRGLHHQPAPISPLNTEYVTIEKTEQSTTTSQHQQDLNNFANYASRTPHCSSHKIDNTSNFNIKTHSEIGWHAVLKIIHSTIIENKYLINEFVVSTFLWLLSIHCDILQPSSYDSA